MSRLTLASLIIIILLLLGIAGRADLENEREMDSLRIEMEQIYNDTGGEFGWPPEQEGRR